MRLPRIALLLTWAGLTGLAYYLILFTTWGNVYHGASYLGVVLTDMVTVLAILSCLEVLRSEPVVAFRALAGAVGAPLVLVTLLLLWYGVRRYLAA
jgi:hypothetical protein